MHNIFDAVQTSSSFLLVYSLAVECSSSVVVVVVLVVVVEKKVLSHPTMGGVILRLGALPEPWESENT